MAISLTLWLLEAFLNAIFRDSSIRRLKDINRREGNRLVRIRKLKLFALNGLPREIDFEGGMSGTPVAEILAIGFDGQVHVALYRVL
jgi:hypothetical protein